MLGLSSGILLLNCRRNISTHAAHYVLLNWVLLHLGVLLRIAGHVLTVTAARNRIMIRKTFQNNTLWDYFDSL